MKLVELINNYRIQAGLFLFYLLYPWQDISLFINYFKPFYAILILLTILAIFDKKLSFNTKLSLFLLPFVLFLLWTNITMYISVKPIESIYANFKYFTYVWITILLTTAITSQGKDEKNFFKIIYSICYSIFTTSLVVSIIYIYKYVSFGGLELLKHATDMNTIAKIASINVGFGGGRNLLASWMAFTISFALPVLSLSRKKLAILIGMILFTAVIIMTLSRTAMLSLLLFLFLLLKNNTTINEMKYLKQTKRILLFTGIIFFFLFSFNIFNIQTFLTTRFKLILDTLKGSNTDLGTAGRLELWSYAIKSFLSSPIYGTGIGTLYKGMAEIGGVHNYHNIFLQILAQTGIIGLFLFIVWSLWIFYHSTYLEKSIEEDNLRFLARIVKINLILYYFKSLLMFQYFDMEIWTTIGILAALYLHKEEKVIEKAT